MIFVLKIHALFFLKKTNEKNHTKQKNAHAHVPFFWGGGKGKNFFFGASVGKRQKKNVFGLQQKKKKCVLGIWPSFFFKKRKIPGEERKMHLVPIFFS